MSVCFISLNNTGFHIGRKIFTTYGINCQYYNMRKWEELKWSNMQSRSLFYFILFYFLLFVVGWDWVSWYCGNYWPTVPAPDDRWYWRNWWNKDWQGKPKYSEKACPSATLFTTSPTWLDPGLNSGRRGGKPATNCLTYGAASHITLLRKCFTSTLFPKCNYCNSAIKSFFSNKWSFLQFSLCTNTRRYFVSIHVAALLDSCGFCNGGPNWRLQERRRSGLIKLDSCCNFCTLRRWKW
jgi:hypothetical protein